MSAAGIRKLADEIGGFATDPFGHAQLVYPWGEPGPLQAYPGPRRWQAEVLREIGDHLSNPATRFTPKRIATATGHGPGKTAAIGMIVTWAMDTCVDTRIVLTANTENQLVTKLSPELAKWRNMSLTKDWFRAETMSHKSVERDRDKSWRADLVPWSTHQPEAFAGLHNAGRRIVVVFDEAAAIEDRIWEVTEGALTDSDTEILWLAFGNPTRVNGRFRECFGAQRHLWSCRQIDSRAVEGTNKKYLDEIIATYGEDSDIARVRVRGQFPNQSSLTFIGRDLVEAARQRELPVTDYLPSEPVIFGLDHARFGDDQTVLAIRQGRDARSRPWLSWNGANSMEIAGRVAEAAGRYHPDAIFVDAGGPNAGGVIDRLRQLMGDAAERVFEINFGSKMKGMEARGQGAERVLVANQRAKMWVEMRTWLQRGAIPHTQRLADDLIGPEYSYDVFNSILLEKKTHMKARGIASPDWGDALALTFAEEVMPRQVPEFLNPKNYGPVQEFDRYAELDERDGYSDLYERYGMAMPSVLQRSRYDR